MSLVQFAFISFGGAGPKVRIEDFVASKNGTISQTASYSLENDGDIVTITDAGTVDEGNWVNPKAAAGSAYEVRATVNLGSVTGGSSATGSWLSLGTTRTWFCTQTGTGTATATLTIEIRLAASGAVLSTAEITIIASVL